MGSGESGVPLAYEFVEGLTMDSSMGSQTCTVLTSLGGTLGNQTDTS